MKLTLLILKNLLKNSILIFVIYLIIVNVTINVENLIDGFIKSVCLGVLLVPMSLINKFNSLIAKQAKYVRVIEFNRPLEESFKITRTLLKTMCDLKLINSDRERGEIYLESDYSSVLIKLESVNDGHVSFIIDSTPKEYDNLVDFNNYVKDAKNIISSLKLNFDPENYDSDSINGLDSVNNATQEFKPCIILYYRLFKVLSTFLLTLILYIGVYYYAINLLPNVSTIMFFVIIFLYLLYMFSKEIDLICKLLECPVCKEKLINKKYSLQAYKVPSRCKKCNVKLLETLNSENISDK